MMLALREAKNRLPRDRMVSSRDFEAIGLMEVSEAGPRWTWPRCFSSAHRCGYRSFFCRLASRFSKASDLTRECSSCDNSTTTFNGVLGLLATPRLTYRSGYSVNLTNESGGVLGFLATLPPRLVATGLSNGAPQPTGCQSTGRCRQGAGGLSPRCPSPCTIITGTWMWEIWDELVEDDEMVPEAPGGSFAQE